MAENTVELKLKADAKSLVRGVGRSERVLRGFSNKSKRMLSGIGRGLGRTLTSIPAQLGFAGVAAGLVVAGKGVVDFDSKLTRFSINAKISRKTQQELRDEINRTALATGQSQNDILEGLDAIVQRTGKFKMARESIGGIGIAATATGADMQSLGALSSQLGQKFGLTGDSIYEALNILTVQGKEGAFTLENLAGLGERLFASAGRLDMSGLDDLKKLGAFAQIARMNTGSSEQATTAVERTLSNILAKEKQISKHGFEIKDKNGKIKELDVILKGIIKATKGNEAILGRLFGEEGIRAVSGLAKEFRKTKAFAHFDELINVNDNVLMKDFARASETAAFQFGKLKVVGAMFANQALAKPIEDLTNWLRELTGNPEKLEALGNDIKNTTEALNNMLKTVIKLVKWTGKIGDLLGWTAKKWGKHQEWLVKDEIERKMGMSGVNADEDFYRKRFRESFRQQSINKNLQNQVNNQISVNVNVDKEGRLKSASVQDRPQAGVNTTTFLSNVFASGVVQ